MLTWQSDRVYLAQFGASHAYRSMMLHGARILVADDDPELLCSVAAALEQLGAEVVRAQNGGELIEHLADDGPFTVVVADVAMPWMTGLQVLHSARTAGLGTPVVVMTALKGERLVEQVQALGRNAVLLRKPFELEELESAVSSLVSHQQEE
jgi:CheY-like chemotaxis protein